MLLTVHFTIFFRVADTILVFRCSEQLIDLQYLVLFLLSMILVNGSSFYIHPLVLCLRYLLTNDAQEFNSFRGC